MVPDFLGLSKSDPKDYFNLIINATASIFGILIAVILLTFEFVKQISFRRKDENLLTKGVVINIVSLAIIIITFSLVSYIDVKDFKQSNNISIGYFIGYLFIYFVISIFPATKGILESANSLAKVLNEIENLTIQQLAEIATIDSNKFIAKDNNLALIRIRQELLSSVRESDYEAYSAIIDKLNKRCIGLIGKGENRRTTEIVFRGYAFILSAGNFEALRVGNNQYYATVWESIEELYECAAKEKIYLLHYQYLDFFIQDFLKFLSRNKLGDALSIGVKTLIESFKLNLKYNCPAETQIWDLYNMFEKQTKIPYLIDKSIQWESITEIIWQVNSILDSSLENDDRELFQTCIFQLEHLTNEIEDGKNFPDLGKYQEAYILIRIISQQAYSGFQATQQKLFPDSSRVFNIQSRVISNLIKKERFYIKKILPDISDFLIKNQRQKTLSDFSSLNNWGAIGRHIADVVSKNETARISMLFIVNTLKKIKTEIEQSQLPDETKNYKEVKKQLNSLLEYMNKDPLNKNSQIIAEIEESLKAFKNIKEATDYKIIKWGSKN